MPKVEEHCAVVRVHHTGPHLEALLVEHPDVVEKLRVLVAQVREALPAPQQSWVQTNIARDQACKTSFNMARCMCTPAGTARVVAITQAVLAAQAVAARYQPSSI